MLLNRKYIWCINPPTNNKSVKTPALLCLLNLNLSMVLGNYYQDSCASQVVYCITSWEIDGETVETVSDFIFLGSKITADDDCSHEIKRHLLLGRKVMTNLDSIFKSRDITLATKVHLVKAMVFPVVMYGCESWTVKKAECRRIDAFELRCWKRLLRVPWTERRCNQSILKEISPGISLAGMMLKLKLQYFGHLMRRVDSLERGWDGWKASLTRWTWVWVNSGSWWWTGRPGVLRFMESQRVGHDWVTELNWKLFSYGYTDQLPWL